MISCKHMQHKYVTRMHHCLAARPSTLEVESQTFPGPAWDESVHVAPHQTAPMPAERTYLETQPTNYSKKIQDSNDVSENEFYTILPVWKVSVIFLQVESCCFAKGLCLEA